MKETFARKIGPLPMYAWLLVVAAVIVGWAWWKSRGKSSASSTASTTADASQVPQFVNQTFTTVQPPSAPSTTAASAGDGVSRSHRSPKVRHQINQIHQEWETSQDDDKKPSGQVHRPARKAPARKAGPVRRG